MKWTDEYRDYFCEIVPGHTVPEIQELFAERFGVQLTEWQIRNNKARFNVVSWRHHGKPCGKPKPVGSESVRAHGEIWVKIAERPTEEHPQCWVPKRVAKWEEYHHQKVPEKWRVLFADKDVTNFSENNLVAVPSVVATRMNLDHAIYYDRESLLLCVDIAKVQLAVSERELSGRTCIVCGKPFRASCERQRRCRECIDAGRTA